MGSRLPRQTSLEGRPRQCSPPQRRVHLVTSQYPVSRGPLTALVLLKLAPFSPSADQLAPILPLDPGDLTFLGTSQ